MEEKAQKAKAKHGTSGQAKAEAKTTGAENPQASEAKQQVKHSRDNAGNAGKQGTEQSIANPQQHHQQTRTP